VNAQETNPKAAEENSAPLVFVVDDSEPLAEMIKVFLAEAGYNVRVFSHPLQALAVMEARKERPRLLISDYRMPGINGLELIHRCKLIDPGLKVIAASANILDEELEKYPFQPDKILPKPYTTSDLLDMVHSLLSE
jgi:CheY-like chemotaxis protein